MDWANQVDEGGEVGFRMAKVDCCADIKGINIFDEGIESGGGTDTLTELTEGHEEGGT